MKLLFKHVYVPKTLFLLRAPHLPGGQMNYGIEKMGNNNHIHYAGQKKILAHCDTYGNVF